MNTHGYSGNKQAVLKRLKRAEGQVRGVASMVEQDAYCIDVLTQISAARAALDRAALELVRDHAQYCMANDNEAERAQKANELVDVLGRMMK